MKIRTSWKLEAQQKLDTGYDQLRKITVFHSAITLGISLLLSALALLIEHFVADTGGLSGIQTRNMLQTLQSLLNSLYSIVQPFWMIGILFAYMCHNRGQQPRREHLLAGFRRLGPVFRLYLLKGLLLVVMAMPCAYLAAMLTVHMSQELITVLKPVTDALANDPAADVEQLIQQIPLKELLGAMIPTLAVFGGLYLTVLVYFGCRMRFASYVVLDTPKCGAMAAIKESFRMTKGRVGTLLMLDLSFWLYYVLLGLATILAFADLLLPQFGVPLPQWAGLICYSLYAAAMLGLDYTVRPRVEATYALVYDALHA